jgi:hypothetical protein
MPLKSLVFSYLPLEITSSLPSVCNFGSLNAIAVTSPENSVTHGADGMLCQDVAEHCNTACRQGLQ